MFALPHIDSGTRTWGRLIWSSRTSERECDRSARHERSIRTCVQSVSRGTPAPCMDRDVSSFSRDVWRLSSSGDMSPPFALSGVRRVDDFVVVPSRRRSRSAVAAIPRASYRGTIASPRQVRWPRSRSAAAAIPRASYRRTIASPRQVRWPLLAWPRRARRCRRGGSTRINLSAS